MLRRATAQALSPCASHPAHPPLSPFAREGGSKILKLWALPGGRAAVAGFDGAIAVVPARAGLKREGRSRRARIRWLSSAVAAARLRQKYVAQDVADTGQPGKFRPRKSRKASL